MDQQWTDPFQMDMDISSSDSPSTKVNIPPITSSPETQDCNCETNNDKIALIYYKRIVGMILNDVNIDNNDNTYKGEISINLSLKEYDTLKNNIGKDVLKSTQYIDNDQILSKACKKSVMQTMSNFILSWQDIVLMTFTLRNISIILACFALLLTVKKLYYHNVTKRSIITCILFVAWGVDYLFTYIRMYQKAEIDQTVDILKQKIVPDSCDPDKIGLLKSAWQFISGKDECKEYHQTLYKDVFWEISPFVVLSEQFVVPAQKIGNAVGNMVSGIMSSLPFGLSIIVMPILLFLLLLLACIILCFVTKTGFAVNILHLIKFSFNHAQPAIKDDNQSSQTSHVTHRLLIEEVPSVKGSENNPQLKSIKNKIVNEFRAIGDNINNVSANETNEFKATGDNNSNVVSNKPALLQNEDGSGDKSNVKEEKPKETIVMESNENTED